MAKQFYFYDAAGTRRRVKSFYFYDSTGARRAVRAGYFYNANGERKQFFAGGLQPPATGYFPGSNFTMKAGENATLTGFQGGSFGEVKPDAGAGSATFPLYPTTVADPHLAQMLYANRSKASSYFDMYFYRSPFLNPDNTTKFWGYQMFDQAGSLLDVLMRTSATETVGASDVLYRWPYIYPFTVGSNYTFIAKELAANTSVVAGQSGIYYGYSNGTGGWSAHGSIADANVTTRPGWTIATFTTSSDDLATVLELVGPPGATDPGKMFIAGLSTTLASVGTKTVADAQYGWNSGQRCATWIWEDSGQMSPGVGYTLLLG